MAMQCNAMQKNVLQCFSLFSTVQCDELWHWCVGSTLPLVKVVKVTILSLAYNTIRPCAQRRRHSSKLNVNIGDNAVTTLAPRSWIHIVRSLSSMLICNECFYNSPKSCPPQPVLFVGCVENLKTNLGWADKGCLPIKWCTRQKTSHRQISSIPNFQQKCQAWIQIWTLKSLSVYKTQIQERASMEIDEMYFQGRGGSPLSHFLPDPLGSPPPAHMGR